jgi:hypothetical protein
MRRSIFSVPILVAALVVALVPAAARADGLPVLGLDVGSALRVARAPSAGANSTDRKLPVSLLLGAGGLALVAAAAGVVLARRRGRRTLIRNLDPQGEN